MFLKLTFSRYHISQCSESLLSHLNYHNLNYQELKLIHIKLCEWQKISSPTPVIEHIFGLSGPLFWSPPVRAVAHSAPAPVAGHAPCSHPEKLVPGPGAGARSERVIRPGTRPEQASITSRMNCGSPLDESLQTRHFTSHYTQQPLTSSLSAHFTTLSWNMSSKQGG